jgi:transcription termination factor Rho
MAAEALEQSMLESKDKEQLLAIAQALGIKTTARSAKATLISKILETTGSGSEPAPASSNGHAAPSPAAPAPAPAPAADAPAASAAPAPAAPAAAEPEVVLGPDGEPLADWEVELMRSGEAPAEAAAPSGAAPAETAPPAPHDAGADEGDGEGDGEGDEDRHGGEGADGESRNSRRRRRRRNKSGRADGPQGSDRYEGGGQRDRDRERDRDRSGAASGESSEAVSQEPVKVGGYLDLRDEGYGFLRVNGYLPSRDDAYIPVKLTRQYGLRKGDFVTGLSRPAGRNEKNPAMLEIHTVNGGDPDKARNRKRFEDLTALFPDEKLRLENPQDPANMTARIIDLISPIGKGQRGIIVSPPKAGKTTIMKTIATSIETNHPEVKLIVLLIDERPEEVTDMRRTVRGEVIASTFDRPSDEHTHVAELAIEKAKRLVEQGDDVVIILDGITRLSRAYNLAAPASGRILSGGIDAGALYPPKKFFGAARNVEEGGSLTILATALVETNSRMDDAIFEEFKGTGNMELRLDRKLAERRIYPAIDVDASSTRHEELLFDRKQLQMVWKLRRVLSGLAADGNAAPGLELLVDRLKTFRTNDEFLNEIAKQPSS